MLRETRGLRLTAPERILLHLAEFSEAPDAFEVGAELSLEGVCRGTGIELRHLAQSARPLFERELIQERRTHVKGSRQRRKVYGLTDAGKREAYRLRRELRSRTIAVRDAAGFREMTVGDVLRAPGTKASLLGLLRQASVSGVVDLEGLAAPPHAGFVEMLPGVPTVGRFVGRRVELETILHADDGPRVLVVRGVAGIGKSWLGAKACALLHGERNLFWYRIRAWDTSLSILASLGGFLAALGRPGLTYALGRGEPGQSVRCLSEDLPGSRSFLVFDDAQEATPEALAALEIVTEAIAGATDVRALILTRRNLPFYDRRDVVLRGLIGEIDLGGLTPDQALELLAPVGREPPPMNVVDRLGGHPLFLELVRSTAGTPAGTALKDVRRFIEEEIYATLSDPERRMMKLASLYRVPVPRAALYADAALTQDVLMALLDRSLVQSTGPEEYVVHDTIRDFFASVLSPAEFQTLGAFAVRELRQLAAVARAARRWSSCRDCLQNAIPLAPPGEERAALWEAAGDADHAMGDLPATVVAYKEAVREDADRHVGARVHRKAAMAFETSGRPRLALQELEAGRTFLGDAPSEEGGWLDLVACRVLQHLEEWKPARANGLASLDAFEAVGDRRGQAEALLELGAIEVHSLDAHPPLAASHYGRAQDLARSLADEDVAAEVDQHLAHFFAYHGSPDPGAVEREIAGLARSAEVLDSPRLHLVHRLLEGWYALDFQGDLLAARSLFDEAAALARKTYDSSLLVSAKSGLACAAYFQGRFAEARDGFREVAVELTAPASMFRWGRLGGTTEAIWLAAECCLLSGDFEGLSGACHDMDRVRVGLPTDFPVLVAVARGLGALADGDVDASASLLRGAAEVGDAELRKDPGPFMNYAYVPQVYRGVMCDILGDGTEARRHVARAREMIEQSRLRSVAAFLPEWETRLTSELRHLIELGRSGSMEGTSLLSPRDAPVLARRPGAAEGSSAPVAR